MRRAALLGLAVTAVLALTGCEDAVKENAEQAQGTREQASEQEARLNLKSIGTGAEAYFQDEHASADGMTATSHAYPRATTEVCSSSGPEGGGAIEAGATRWSERPWSDLRFSMSRPHHFQYCYQSSPDGKRFVAWAIGTDTVFCVQGEADGTVSPVRQGDGACGL